MTDRPVESMLIAAAALSLFVVATQAVGSLLGRRVPIPVLQRATVHPHHRRGILRPLGLVVMLGVAALTQALIVTGLIDNVGLPRMVYALELAAAVAWAVVLIRVARQAADRE